MKVRFIMGHNANYHVWIKHIICAFQRSQYLYWSILAFLYFAYEKKNTVALSKKVFCPASAQPEPDNKGSVQTVTGNLLLFVSQEELYIDNLIVFQTPDRSTEPHTLADGNLVRLNDIITNLITANRTHSFDTVHF